MPPAVGRPPHLPGDNIAPAAMAVQSGGCNSAAPPPPRPSSTPIPAPSMHLSPHPFAAPAAIAVQSGGCSSPVPPRLCLSPPLVPWFSPSPVPTTAPTVDAHQHRTCSDRRAKWRLQQPSAHSNARSAQVALRPPGLQSTLFPTLFPTPTGAKRLIRAATAGDPAAAGPPARRWFRCCGAAWWLVGVEKCVAGPGGGARTASSPVIRADTGARPGPPPQGWCAAASPPPVDPNAAAAVARPLPSSACTYTVVVEWKGRRVRAPGQWRRGSALQPGSNTGLGRLAYPPQAPAAW